jgi:hypothetical protein
MPVLLEEYQGKSELFDKDLELAATKLLTAAQMDLEVEELPSSDLDDLIEEYGDDIEYIIDSIIEGTNDRLLETRDNEYFLINDARTMRHTDFLPFAFGRLNGLDLADFKGLKSKLLPAIEKKHKKSLKLINKQIDEYAKLPEKLTKEYAKLQERLAKEEEGEEDLMDEEEEGENGAPYDDVLEHIGFTQQGKAELFKKIGVEVATEAKDQ